ncbi:hypothetical protein MBLNU459_g1994t1 [Dothideomycetes sp. NU459]
MAKWRYGVILDAGSSGTRVHIYRWLNSARAKQEADNVLLESVSTFAEKPELVGSDHLAGLVEHALSFIPAADVPDTPIFLLATAGMRLLLDYQRKAVLDNICSYLKKNTQFLLPDCALHVQVIPGETEGLYGWIAANYLLGGFDGGATDSHNHGKGHHTYGFLDMGGASAQIAFAPNATEAEKHADDLKLLRMRKVSGESVEYKVFVTTWLGYGVNEARRRYVEALLEASPGAQELPDPCLPSGLTVTKSGHVILPGSDAAKGKEAHLLGTGTFTECLKRTFPLLDKNAPCINPPCLLHGVHVPAIDFDVNHFVGVSEYWHTTHQVFEMGHKDKAYDLTTYQQKVIDFCSQDWTAIGKGVAAHKWGNKVDESTAVEVCFKASWLINMLHDGIGIPRVGLEPTHPSDGHNGTKAVLDGAKKKGFLDPFQAVDKIEGTEVSWTLGKMVLYAASQVPPSNNALAVGFGSNTVGPELPKDFQFAGGKYKTLPDDLSNADNSIDGEKDWHDALFTSGSSRRVPGLILFLLILVVAAFLLCGRDRRSSLYHRLLSLLGRSSSSSSSSSSSNSSSSKPLGRRRAKPAFSLASKLFGNTNQSYERVGAGENGNEPQDVELGDLATATSDSDSDSGSTVRGANGRSSGWATPKAGYASPQLSHSSPRGKGYFDGGAGSGSVSVVPPPIMSAPGLSMAPGMGARTASRERLVPGPLLRSASRNGSRATSPSRRSPLITPLKEFAE